EQHVHPAVLQIDGAGHEGGAVQLAPASGVSGHGARRLGTWMELERELLNASEPAARAAEEPSEVVAGDVLHDLAAGVRARPVGQRDGDPDHEVAHAPEP